MSKFSPVPFAEEILKKTKIVYDRNKILWRYDNNEGIWIPRAEQFIKSTIRMDLLGEEQQKINYVEEILNHIKDTTYDESFEIDRNPFLIAFKNGVYDLKEDKLKDFSPDYYITNKLKIPLEIDNKDCPAIDKFFEECLDKEHKIILYDLCAYCLFKRYPYPKIFFVHGAANTGKSKFLQLLETFLGKENVCSVEPQDIQKDPHATAQMLYKMANIVSDINYDALDNINQVKKITGEDTLKIRNMYKEPYNARIYAKQIFSTNKLPVVKEKTRAWYKRAYTIEFSNIITKDKEDCFLMNKLTTEEELKGLASQCLKHLKKLYKADFIFTFDVDIDEMEKVYEKLSNPVLLFIERHCVTGEGFVYQFEFKDRLNNWLKVNHFPATSTSEIREIMLEQYLNSNRPSFNGDKTYRVWSGLRWKGADEITTEITTTNQFNQFNLFNQG